MSYLHVEQPMTSDEFLQWQALQEDLHELIDGRLLPLPPRDASFFRLLVNLTSAIRTALGGESGWEAFTSADPVIATGLDVVRPDAFFARSDERFAPAVACAFPSAAGGLADIRRLGAQRRITTLKELVSVDRDARIVSVERRSPSGGWTTSHHGVGSEVRLDFARITFPVADVFAGFDRADARLTLEEFCAWESSQPRRHEFFHGRILAMTGARLDHGTACMNLAARLHQHLRGSPCRVFSENAAVLNPIGTYFYPDVVVTCEPINGDQRWMLQPILVIEVLSVSTQRFDRTEKAQAYFRIPSLREYVLVDHVRRRIDLHRRGPDGHWSRHPSIGEAPLHLQSLDLTIPAEAIYERIAASNQAAA